MGAIINQGTDLDPEEIPNDPLYISSDNDEEQRVKEKIHSTDREPPIWLLLQVVLLLAILVISVFITLKGS